MSSNLSDLANKSQELDKIKTSLILLNTRKTSLRELKNKKIKII